MHTQELPFWLNPVWERLLMSHQQARLPHAMIFSGPKGIGKLQLAQCFSQAMLCVKDPDSGLRACGKCTHCMGVLAATSPDYKALVVAEKKTEISIDQIREFCAWMALSATNGTKIGVIVDADQMNRSGYNALLKTLEEPGSGSIMVLISSRPEFLPATILSRCQTFFFSPPEASQAQRWLRENGGGDKHVALAALCAAAGAPLAAQALCEEGHAERFLKVPDGLVALKNGGTDPVSQAMQWAEWDQTMLWSWLATWIAMVVRVQSGFGQVHEAFSASVQKLAVECNNDALFNAYEQCLQNRVLQATTVKNELLLEDFLIEW